jgi:hypothetical protein
LIWIKEFSHLVIRRRITRRVAVTRMSAKRRRDERHFCPFDRAELFRPLGGPE